MIKKVLLRAHIPSDAPPCWELCEDMIRNYDKNVKMLNEAKRITISAASLEPRVDGGSPSSKVESDFARITSSKTVVTLERGITPVQRAYEYISKKHNSDDIMQLIELVYGKANLPVYRAAELLYVSKELAGSWRKHFIRLVAASMCDRCHKCIDCDFTKGV